MKGTEGDLKLSKNECINSKKDDLEDLQELLSSLTVKSSSIDNKSLKVTGDELPIKISVQLKLKSGIEAVDDQQKETNSHLKQENEDIGLSSHICEENKGICKLEDEGIKEIAKTEKTANEAGSSNLDNDEPERSKSDVEEIAIKLKLSQLDSEDDESSEEDESNYLKRGPLTEHKNHSYRFSPLSPNTNSNNNQNHGHYPSPVHENNNTSIFNSVEFHQLSNDQSLSQNYGLNQSPFYMANGDNYSPYSQLSPESVHSNNSSSPMYTPNFTSGCNPNDYMYQPELSNYLDSPAYDFSNQSFESYQPLSPPGSVSPLLKEGIDSNTQFSSYGENENFKESEDLINIINTINKTSKAKAKGIPETELQKLRSVLEGNEDAIRDEMGMYLKDDNSHFQPSFNAFEESSVIDSTLDDYKIHYEVPLTPPKSVSPVQDALLHSNSSPISDCKEIKDFDSYSSEEDLLDMLNGLKEIDPEELDIYLVKERNACDPPYAKGTIQAKCKPNNLDHALRRLSSISAKYLCKKDDDGDTCLMIVYSKQEDTPDFFENIFCLQEKVIEIRVCCDAPLGKAKRCKVCGNTDTSKFYTPLSLKNKQGDTALSCAVKTNHSSLIINYLLHGIMQCPEDFRRVFDEKGKAMFADVACKYPCLNQYI